MKEAFTPGVLLAETHFHMRAAKGAIADAVARVADEGFYGAVEIADVPDAGDRGRIGAIVRGRGLRLTQWASMVLNGEALDLSALDETLRGRSVARLKELIGPFAECGAWAFAVLSGPDPGPELRGRATERLAESLRELGGALEPTGMRLLLEPLDRGAHKNRLIGPTPEAAALVRRLRAEFPGVGLAFDTAHAALCGEDPADSMEEHRGLIDQMHLANAVLARGDPAYGDHHMPPGAPGFLSVERIAGIMRRAVKAGFFGGGRRPGVSMEVRTPPGGDPWTTEAVGRRAMAEAWERAAAEG